MAIVNAKTKMCNVYHELYQPLGKQRDTKLVVDPLKFLKKRWHISLYLSPPTPKNKALLIILFSQLQLCHESKDQLTNQGLQFWIKSLSFDLECTKISPYFINIKYIPRCLGYQDIDTFTS